MAIRPLQDRVLVKPLDSEEKTAGGIIIPDTAQEKPQEGKIIAAGKGEVAEPGVEDHDADEEEQLEFLAAGDAWKLLWQDRENCVEPQQGERLIHHVYLNNKKKKKTTQSPR